MTVRAGLLWALAATALAAHSPAGAETATTKLISTPAEKFAVAPGGVDMRSGRYAYSETDLAIGGEGAGLVLTRILSADVPGHGEPFGNFSHNWDVMVSELRVNIDNPASGGTDYRIYVHFGGRSQTYQSYSYQNGFTQMSDGYAPLTYSGNDKAAASIVYTYTAADGTKAVFRPLGAGDCSSQRRCAFVSEIIEPDGTKLSFSYVASGGGGGAVRLARVVSSRGYALLLEGDGNLVTKACAINLASAPLPAAGAACPADAAASAAYYYTSHNGRRLGNVTGPDGATSGFTYVAEPGGITAMGFIKPGHTEPWLTNRLFAEQDEEYVWHDLVARQNFADGQSYTYAWSYGPEVGGRPAPLAGGIFRDSEGRSTVVAYGFPIAPGGNTPGSICRQLPCSPPMADDPTIIHQQTPGPTEITDPLGRTTSFDYCDPAVMAGLPPTETNRCTVVPAVSFTDPEGIKTELKYDSHRNVREARRLPKAGAPNPTATPSILTSAVYDTFNPRSSAKPLSMTDALGNVTRWTYSPDHGGVLTETKPAVDGVSPQTRYDYVLFQARTAGGGAAGPPPSLPAPAGLAARLDQRLPGQQCDRQPRRALRERRRRGPHDLRLRAGDRPQHAPPSRPGGERRRDAAEDLLRLRPARPEDQRDLAERHVRPRRLPGKPAHDGARLHLLDPLRRQGAGDWDDRRRPRRHGPLGAPAVRNLYDPAGRLIRVEQGSLAAWQPESVAPSAWAGFTVYKAIDTSYDALDRKTREASSGGGVVTGVTEYSYARDGQVECTAVRMNPNAWSTPLANKCVPGPAHAAYGPDRVSRNVYDSAGQLTEIWQGVGTPQARREALWTFNGNGQKTSLVDARSFRAEMAYDAFGRQWRWTFPSKTATNAVNAGDYEEYRYDANGNRIWLRKRDESILTFQYDALNRMAAKIVPERPGLDPAHTRDVHYGYDNRGLQTRARFDSFGGEGLTNAYDGFGRLLWANTNQGGQSRTLHYQYDADGNRTRITHPGSVAFGYGYDRLGRMTLVHDKAAVATGDDYILRYWYRDSGPRQSAVRGTNSNGFGFVTDYHYDEALRLKTLTSNLPFPGADVTIGLGYNPAGQIVRHDRDNDAYAWKGAYAADRPYAANGLNQYTSAGGASFLYDANGNLARETTAAPASVRTYVYDVENRLVSASGSSSATLTYDPLGRLFQVTGAAGTTQFLYDGDALVGEYDGSGSQLRRYVHGPGTDEPVAVYAGSTQSLANRRYMLPDERGSIAALVNADGSPSVVNTYDEYGIPGTGNSGRFQYTGQAWIPELGMYHYKARLYSPTLGRFLQTDPIGYEGGLNLYTYALNDPVNGVDPTGKVVQLTRSGNDIRMVIHIAYYGDGNTPATRMRFSQSIANAWTGRFGKYTVRTRVMMASFPARQTPTPELKARHPEFNFVEIPAGDGRASVTDSRLGSWPAERPDWTAAHEAGHFANLPDSYDEHGSFPGYENSIMGARDKPVTEKTIDDLLRANGATSGGEPR